MQMDFSANLAACEVIPPESPDYTGALLVVDLPSRSLTPKETQLLSHYRDNHGWQFGCGLTLFAAVGFAEQHGRVPSDGAEFLAYSNPEYATEDGLRRLARLPGPERLHQVASALNPATGRMYTTFESAQWSPFGVLIRKEQGEKATKSMPFHWRDSGSEETQTEFRQYQAWHLVVYGQRPGSVLVDKFIWTDQAGSGRTPSLCGCGKGKKAP
jgi:hypothetical protein